MAAQGSAEGNPSQPPSARLEEILTVSDEARFEELSDTSISSSDEYETIGTISHEEAANITYVNRMTQPIQDDLVTKTSQVQDKTLDEILPFLEGNPNGFPLNEYGIPKLMKPKHAEFLRDCLTDYPPQFAAMDAARPWLVYWSLQGLTALGEEVEELRDRVVATFQAAQHPSGGYGGGHGQMAHLAPTYAAILSLAMVGEPSAYESIDRRSMWHYLGRMKQPDGGFTMADGGEEDIRGAFCAMVVLSLLNLPLELPPDAPARSCGMTSFVDKLGEWISRCQNFEGGISASPGNEAHGAYAFCGLGCLAIMGSPKMMLEKHLDVPLLIQWLSYRQCTPEGGYNGRTNKLVDGCYSHWIGSGWAIVEAAAGEGLWNRAALGRYILSAAQAKRGGLIDKPGKRPDGYHTCYNLAGLAAVQHRHQYDEERKGKLGQGDLGAPYHWKTAGLFEEERVWGEEDLVNEVHPVFVIPYQQAEACREYFEAKESF